MKGTNQVQGIQDPDNTSGGWSWSVRYTQVGHVRRLPNFPTFSGYFLTFFRLFSYIFKVSYTKLGHIHILTIFSYIFLHFNDHVFGQVCISTNFSDIYNIFKLDKIGHICINC